MDVPSQKSKGLYGIAALFDDMERKAIFRKYLYFLCWVELGILLTCWLYQIGDGGHDGESSFPWRLYFLIAFLSPIAITFIMGTIIVGFNKYFAEAEQAAADNSSGETDGYAGNGRFRQLTRMVAWVQKLPFLALLLLLGVGVAFLYKLDDILTVIGAIGEKSVHIVLTSLGVVLLLVSVLALVLIILNYRLRRTAMEYQYKSQVAERLGLVILDDNTVLSSSGRLLLNGRKSKNIAFELLPEGSGENKEAESQSAEGLSLVKTDTENTRHGTE